MVLNKVNSGGDGAPPGPTVGGAHGGGHGDGHDAPPPNAHGGGHGGGPPPNAHGGGHGGGPPPNAHGGGHGNPAAAAGVPGGSGKHGSVADNAGTPDKWATGHVQGGSEGESLDSYSTGGNRSYTSHGLAAQRAKDSAGNKDCPGDPRPNCGCATGLRLVNGLCAHEG